MIKEFYQSKRKELVNQIENDSVVILHSNYEVFKSADSIYDFSVNKNFYYLTGLNESNITLVLGRFDNLAYEWLFIDENDPILVKWVGAKYTKEEAANISGIDIKNIHYNSNFDSFIRNLIQPNRNVLRAVKNIYLDLEVRDIPQYNTFALEYSKEIKNKYPSIVIKNIYQNIIDLRTIKEPCEIEEIKKSIDTTKRAILNVYHHNNEITNEKIGCAYHDFVLNCDGKQKSFGTIMAGGKNACTLHYEDNNSDVSKDDLMLMDLGSSTNGYASDISRTFPIGGKFSKRQKEVYEAVLDTNKKCIKFAKAGITWNELNAYARTLLTEHLIKLGVMETKEELSEYYFHSVSHSLGLDVHDPCDYNKKLRPGMVITIEPGLYIAKEGIGIRIEDDILITETGSVCLSSDLVKEVAELEKELTR